jgi:tetratricopeptide (TPR) repeat protein
MAGCGRSPGVAPFDLPALLREAAQSRQVADTFDRLARAVEDRDENSFLAVSGELQAMRAWPQVQLVVDDLTRNAWDALLLNQFGYTLADKGSTREQFVAAETLTRRALELYSRHIENVGGSMASARERRLLLAALQFQRANIRDSVAWALFRQGRYKEALREQEQAVAEATASARLFKQEVSPELIEHLRAIRRAQQKQPVREGHDEKAVLVPA